MPKMTRSKRKPEHTSAKKEREAEETPLKETQSTRDDVAEESDNSVNEEEQNLHVSSSDSEEAPESISLSTSKDAAIAKRHEEREAIDAFKEQEKQRRRNKDEVLKRQKELRKAREKSRISDDILKKLAERQELVAKQQLDDEDSEVVSPNVHATFDDEEEDDEDDIEEQKGVQLMVLNQTNRSKRGVLDSANNFLKNHFYGNRLKRVETLEDENRKRKSKNFGPAIKFSKTVL